jgi:hypothetical protein
MGCQSGNRTDFIVATVYSSQVSVTLIAVFDEITFSLPTVLLHMKMT